MEMNKTMLKRSVLVLGLVLGFNIGAQAQDEATGILKETQNKVESYKGLEVKFAYEVDYGNSEEVEKYKGAFTAKGNKYKLDIDQTQTYCDGKTRWVYLVESNEVNISKVEDLEDLEIEEQFLNDPLSIFRLYQEGFKFRLTGDVDYQNKKAWQIDFIPEDKTKPYFKIRCWIATNYDMVAIRYFQKDGTKVTMNILEINEAALKDGLFTFKPEKYKDIEIIDLR